MYELVYILPDVEGGVASIVYNLTKFTCSNIFTKVILLDTGRALPVKRQFECETIKVKIDPKKSAYKNAKQLLKHIKKNSIIISNDGAIEFDMIELFGLNNPVVYILHGDFQYYYDVIRQKHHLMDIVISYSDFTFENTKKLLSPSREVSVKKIYYPVPDIKIMDRTCSPVLKIIFAGSLEERKGVHLFPSIVEQLIRKNTNFEFTIVGDGYLRNLVNELDSQYTQVRYLGQKKNEEVLMLMLEHDVFFLPSNSEGLPVAIVEAMKAGLVTVASNINSGIPDVIFDGETGFKVNVGDIEGYVDIIHKLSIERSILNIISQKAVILANRLFNSTIQSNKYKETYIESSFIIKKTKKIPLFKKVIFMLPNKVRLYYTFKIELFIKRLLQK